MGTPCSADARLSTEPGHGWSAPAMTLYFVATPCRHPVHVVVRIGQATASLDEVQPIAPIHIMSDVDIDR